MHKSLLVFGIILSAVFSFQVNHGDFTFNDTFTVSNVKDVFVEPKKELSILAFGDVMLGRYVRVLMDKYGMDYIFKGVKDENGKFFTDADIVHANLEGPIFNEGRKGGTSMVFAFNKDVAPFLKENGFDVVSIANNHSLDMRNEGRDTTISALNDAVLGWCGNPSYADINSVYYGEKNNVKFAFVCFQDITTKLNIDDATALISAVKKNVDYVIVSIHWGYEYSHSPNTKRQKEPGHAFIDSGADLVIGHHPHVVQPFEIYNDKFIFYSLGNFVFDQYWSLDTQEELSVRFAFYGDQISAELFPMKSKGSVSRLMSDDEKAKWLKKFISWGDYDEETSSQILSGKIIIGQ